MEEKKQIEKLENLKAEIRGSLRGQVPFTLEIRQIEIKIIFPPQFVV